MRVARQVRQGSGYWSVVRSCPVDGSCKAGGFGSWDGSCGFVGLGDEMGIVTEV